MISLSNILNLRRESEFSISSISELIMRSQEISDSIIHGMHAQKKAGTGDQFWQYMDYNSKDTPQSIDWRLSAKSDTLFIKQKERQVSRRSYIWRASGKSMDFKSKSNIYTKQDSANILALSLALILRISEEQIGIWGDKKTGRSEREMQKIAQILLNSSTIDETLPNHLGFDIPNNSSLIAIGDFISETEDIERNFKNINTKSAIIIQVLDPAEIGLNYNGRAIFKDISNNEELINNISSIRDEYKKRINAHINEIKSLCHTQGWAYILHITNTNIATTLQNIISEVNNK